MRSPNRLLEKEFSMLAIRGGMMAAVLASGGLALAGEFRLHNQVFVEDQTEPASETFTLFRGGRAYDRLADDSEIVVFDPPHQRFVLLQPGREIRAEITLEQIDALHQRLTEKLREQGDKLNLFVLDPRYEIVPAEGDGPASFRSQWTTYEVYAAPIKDEEIAAELAEFNAWSTKLNALKNPTLLARQPINEWLAAERRVAERVHLVRYKKNLLGQFVQEAEFHSRHTLTSQLSRADLEKIDQIERWLVEFRRATLGEYWESSREE